MFKKLNVLLGLLLLSTPAFAGLPPTTAAGQNGSKLTTFNFQVPNNQATDVGGATLLESGNNNLLINPGFEYKSITSNGWTCTGLTPTIETTTVYSGKRALKLAASGSTFECYQDSSINAAATVSTQYLDFIRMLTTATGTSLKVCSRTNATTSTTNCVDALSSSNPLNNGIYNLIKVPYNGGSTSNGISIAGVAVTGNIFLDNAFAGPQDVKVDGNQTQMQGHYRTTGSFTANNTTTGGTVTSSGVSSLFSYDSSTGKYTLLQPAAISFAFTAVNSSGSTMQPAVYKNGLSTSVCLGSSTTNLNTSCSGTDLGVAGDYYVTYNNSGSVASTATDVVAIKSSNSSTYSSTNADTDWVACNFSTLAWSGLGTVTNNLKCKRQGGDLLINGQFTTGTPTASEIQIPLPLWNGASLTSANSSRIAGTQFAGQIVRQAATTANEVTGLIYPSLNVIKMSIINSGSFFPLSGQNGTSIFGSADPVAMDLRIPIEGWEQSNVMIAKISGLESCADSWDCEAHPNARVTSTGTATSTLNFLSCSAASNVYTCTFTKTFLSAPNIDATTCSTNVDRNVSITSISTTGFTATTRDLVNTSQATEFCVTVHKTGGDYVGKTAMAVASDQNTRTVGATNVEVFSFSYGISGNLNNNCNATPCYVDQIGSAVSSFARASTGNYTLNTVKTYSKLKCTGSYTQATVGIANGTEARCENCSSLAGIQTLNLAGSNVDTVGTLNCMAIP